MTKSADISKKISDHMAQQAATAKAEAQTEAQRAAKVKSELEKLMELIQDYQAPENVDVTFDHERDSQDVTLKVKHNSSSQFLQPVTIMHRDTEWMFHSAGGELKFAPVTIATFTANHLDHLVQQCLTALAGRLGVPL